MVEFYDEKESLNASIKCEIEDIEIQEDFKCQLPVNF